jgi:CHAD domain-containing protein
VSYQFENDEPVATGVRRIVREEIASARERLKRCRVQDRDASIHEVRKSVKRVRAILRLMQPVLEENYVAEAEAWRDMGRKLSPLRDAGAIIGVFDHIRGRYEKPLEIDIRNNLLAGKRKLEDTGSGPGVLVSVAAGMKRAEARLKKWPLTGEGFPAIAAGLEQTYRRGAKALRLAGKDPSAENLHSLRKRVKEHVYQVRLLEGVWDGHLRHHERSAAKLDKMLGERQDLAVLQTKIRNSGSSKDVEEFLEFIDGLAADLTADALKLGARVYGDSSRQLAGRLEKLWNHWTNL